VSARYKKKFLSAFAPLLDGMLIQEPAPLKDASSIDFDAHCMHLALVEAWKGVGRTAPNPPVGAIIAKGGEVLARGHHRRAGGAHAETEAIVAAANQTRGTTLYVTLEPCAHFGRTPPCTDKIIESGFKRVVIGTRDPNPKMNGKGVAALRQAKIEVVMVKDPILAHRAQALVAPFASTMRRDRPYIIAKMAVSLDGRVATQSGDSKWITGEASRRLVHHLRNRVDGIMVGGGTVEADDPSLTVRHHQKGFPSRNPRRIVCDGQLRTNPESQVYTFNNRDGRRASPIVAHTKRATKARREAFDECDVCRIELPETAHQIPLDKLWPELCAHDITSVLVEAGPTLLTSLLDENMIDELWWFVAPTLIGQDGLPVTKMKNARSMADTLRFDRVQWFPIGQDVLGVMGEMR
jgi:diaminohydroxyphosphoribosylaminopyrimidine deaminase/5-amino-6-(5-phosphoribosylamino)uracil reductase